MRWLATLLLLAASPAGAWGPTGHRITGDIAARYLSPKAAAGVRELLGSESLAEASTWADFMRSDPSPFWQKEASPFHYVTVPDGKTYAEVGAPPQGDSLTALARFAATLRDPAASPEAKRLALRFAVHIIGDLAQPLHVGNGTDRGGNDVKVSLFGEETNLHAVWDYGIIDREQLSYSEWADWLDRALTPEQLRQWSSPDPLQWVADSQALRGALYPATPDLGWRYVFAHKATLDMQLAKGGLRIAAWLNALYDRP